MDDPVLKSSRREASLALLFFALAFVVTLVVCARLGYAPDPKPPPRFILGFPAWVFWGIVIPWAASLVFGFWFAFRYMRDEDLGRESDDADGRDG